MGQSTTYDSDKKKTSLRDRQIDRLNIPDTFFYFNKLTNCYLH